MVDERVLGSSDPLTEPATSFGPLDAARAIDSTRAWDATLRQRTEGLTWMMWGIVTTAIGVSYGEVYALNPNPHWAWSLLWVPWVLVGAAFQTLLWRTVSLTPHGAPMPRVARIVLGTIALAGAALLAWGLARQAFGEHVVAASGPGAQVVFTLTIGLLWILAGALLRALSTKGRRVSVGIGLVVVLVGLIPLAAPATPILLGAQLVVGWAPLLGGLYQAIG